MPRTASPATATTTSEKRSPPTTYNGPSTSILLTARPVTTPTRLDNASDIPLMPPRTALILTLYMYFARIKYNQADVSSEPKKKSVEISGPATELRTFCDNSRFTNEATVSLSKCRPSDGSWKCKCEE